MCSSCLYQNLLEEIEEYLCDRDYEWAADTLSGIHETVEEKEHCTERQRDAVGNIVAAVERRGG